MTADRATFVVTLLGLRRDPPRFAVELPILSEIPSCIHTM